MINIKVTEYCQHIMSIQVQEGDICIDATMGRGFDTVHLAELVGSGGHVHSFDIQEDAINSTINLIDSTNRVFYETFGESLELEKRVTLHHESHENMDAYCEPNTVSCIVFNFGYLPGGDHSISTQVESSVVAVNKALQLLEKGGTLLMCIYSGGDTGFEERDALLELARGLDPKKYLVLKTEYFNRVNNPPMPVMVVKL